MTRFALVVAILTLAAGCDPEPMPEDGNVPMDSGTDAAAPDANPPVCDPGCSSTMTCCESFVAEDVCIDLRNDVTNCGSCGVDCVATDRGDSCMNSQCACGIDVLGCLGATESFCCPPRSPGGERYCASLDQSAADCGECNRGCSALQADRCDGGRCQCGTTAGACLGTAESTCCTDGVDVACTDTTTDTIHCGTCNVQCQGGERCEEGSCVRGDSCDGGCALGEICCDGSCCARSRCMSNVCVDFDDAGVRLDGGAGDAGAPDAGSFDAGVSDAGPSDAGSSDAGASDSGPSLDAG